MEKLEKRVRTLKINNKLIRTKLVLYPTSSR